MVLKRSKYGLNSGNSFSPFRFREIMSRGLLHTGTLTVSYRIPIDEYEASDFKAELQEIASRRIASIMDKLGFHDDATVSRVSPLTKRSSDAVLLGYELSLSKRRRWLLSDELFNAIESRAFAPPPAIEYNKTASRDSKAKQSVTRSGDAATAGKYRQKVAVDTGISNCGLSLVRYRAANTGMKGLMSVGDKSKPSSCALYANSDAPRRIVYARESEQRRRTNHVVSDYRDMLNTAYCGALASASGNTCVETRRQKVRNVHHNEHFRGVQRPTRVHAETAAFPEARRPRRRADMRTRRASATSKTTFQSRQPLQRAEVCFSVVESRGLTTQCPLWYKGLRWPQPTRPDARVLRRSQVSSFVHQELDLLDCDCDFGCFNDGFCYENALNSDSTSASPTRQCFDLSEFVVTTRKNSRRKVKKRATSVDQLSDTTTWMRQSESVCDSQSQSTTTNDVTVTFTAETTYVDQLCDQLESERKRSAITRLTFSKSQLDSDWLASQFDGRYAEAQSAPRVVMLELRNGTKQAEAEAEAEANLLLSIEEDETATEEVNAKLRLNVHLNEQSSNATQVQFEQLVANVKVEAKAKANCADLHRLYEAVQCMLQMHAVNQNQSSSVKVSGLWRQSNKRTTQLTSLQTVPTGLVKLNKLASASAFASASCTNSQESKDKDQCEICYCNCKAMEAVRIAPCNHTFCTACLARYVIGECSAIPPRIALQCASYGCKTQLDQVTLCNLLPCCLYFAYLGRLREWQVSKSALGFVWCPDSKCSVLLSLSDSKLPMCNEVHCAACELHFCADCGNQAHFPVSCKDNRTFTLVLRQRKQCNKQVASAFSFGRASVSPTATESYTAKVKHCPGCKTVMEKGTGCSHMTCRCGHEFCWECLGNWYDHVRANNPLVCKAQTFEARLVELIDLPLLTMRRREEQMQLALTYRSACADQCVRLRYVHGLQSGLNEQKIRSLQLGAAALLLQRCGAALQMLVDALGFISHVHANVFVWNAASNSRLVKRERAGLTVVAAARRLNQPLDTLNFALLRVNDLLNELLKFQELFGAVEQQDSTYCLCALMQDSKLKKGEKLEQLTGKCHGLLTRCRALAYHTFQAVGC